MYHFQQENHKASTHQTVTEEIRLKTGGKTIKITTTDAKLSAHAGQATFWAFLHRVNFRGLLTGVLPHRRTSPNALAPVEIALSFLAGMEGVIKELDHGFALPKLCCQKFWATEAALSLAVLTYNLTVLFLRHLGWLERNSVTTLRYRLFGAAGILSHAQGTVPIRLGIPPAHRPWWRAVWEKILAAFPNCDAVGQQPRPA